MRKRLRKKKRVGEFQELGFEVTARLRWRDEAHEFCDRWLAAVEARELGFGGKVGLTVHGFVARAGRGTATEDDRVALALFLAGDPAVLQHELGALRDAWYGWDG